MLKNSPISSVRPEFVEGLSDPACFDKLSTSVCGERKLLIAARAFWETSAP
jgi:hypothetical protein